MLPTRAAAALWVFFAVCFLAAVTRGGQQGVTLVIDFPRNGEVVDETSLNVSVTVAGFAMPSDGREICLGLESGEQKAEQCFERMLPLSVQGLSPGSNYTLRLSLREHGSFVAVSMRFFSVALIQLPAAYVALAQMEPIQRLSIEDALQVAFTHHERGNTEIAEKIYVAVLQQKPNHATTHHSLGVLYHQRGDPKRAVAHVERALALLPPAESAYVGSETDEGSGGSDAEKDDPAAQRAKRKLNRAGWSRHNFHNTLGECYRAMGALDDAMAQFEMAIALRPTAPEVHHNMGLILEGEGDLADAAAHYRKAIAVFSRMPGYEEQAQVVQSRLCSVILRMARIDEARACIVEGLELWSVEGGEKDTVSGLPMSTSGVLYNDLGNLNLQLGDIVAAEKAYRTAAAIGYVDAEMNIATVLELQGFSHDARSQLEHAEVHFLKIGDRSALSYIAIKKATILPRIYTSEGQIVAVRRRMKEELGMLAVAEPPLRMNEDPVHSGFSLAFYLAYHGVNNVALKSALARSYIQACGTWLKFEAAEATAAPHHLLQSYSDSDSGGGGLGSMLVDLGDALELDGGDDKDSYGGGDDDDDGGEKEKELELLPQVQLFVGFVSRFFYKKQSVSKLIRGVMKNLDRSRFYVVAFTIMTKSDDEKRALRDDADEVVELPMDLHASRQAIRQWSLDVLIYPELGMDPVSYFLAFGRIAPVQVAWWGHPDTTGIPSIDYFVSTDVEIAGADAHYSEKLFRLKGLGTHFTRPASPECSVDICAARLRARLRCRGAEAVLPHTQGSFSALQPIQPRVYLCVQSLFKLLPRFDHAITAILRRDPHALIVLVEPQKRAAAMLKLLRERLRSALIDAGLGREVRLSEEHFGKTLCEDEGEEAFSSTAAVPPLGRVLFLPRLQADVLLEVMKGASIVLDSFPFGGGVTSLQTLAVGTPIVTMPSDMLAGRLTLAMYRRMNLSSEDTGAGPVQTSVEGYVDAAIRIASTSVGTQLRRSIEAKSSVLFDDPTAVKEWENFLFNVTLNRLRAAFPKSK